MHPSQASRLDLDDDDTAVLEPNRALGKLETLRNDFEVRGKLSHSRRLKRTELGEPRRRDWGWASGDMGAARPLRSE